jgi:putative ABC transport system substrate-binding protein
VPAVWDRLIRRSWLFNKTAKALGLTLALSLLLRAERGDRVSRIEGADPADLPVEEPSKFELIVNQKAARTLGLTIPPSMLLRADQVIK